eukprot:TRINITY_DN9948_c0_g1_i2.p1 TRINITY_DN9948_c0_g1~~TRINITY_DN9948_c0_g1_i2.p1  ORF type:complete len:108 (+),score=10.15 TRINITY_DN9948_c0_g1_i2:97-420(+)
MCSAPLSENQSASRESQLGDDAIHLADSNLRDDRMGRKLMVASTLQFFTAAFLHRKGMGGVNIMPLKAFMIATLIVGGTSTAIGAAIYEGGIRGMWGPHSGARAMGF